MDSYLIDTSIWIDLYENRVGFNNEPLGDYAFRLFCLIKSTGCKIVITDSIIRELEVNYPIPAIRGMMKPFEIVIDNIISSRRQINEAKIIAETRNVPKGDALLAIIARDNNLLMVSRDKHFYQLADICEFHTPEDLI
ncbi:hypothetical protein KY329_03550 [Candidatus Woesearchaeota archaeon]|nr:hypothetical protein [Candidatus Woesearchaeota archaeon]